MEKKMETTILLQSLHLLLPIAVACAGGRTNIYD